MALVAVGGGTIGTSVDGGSTWVETTTADTYNAIAWTGTLLVAVGVSACMTSPDGEIWTARTIPAGTYNAIVWNGALLVAVGTSVVATSPDGITWTSRTIPAGTYYGVAWNGTVFAAVGSGVAATSPDGITWTSRTVPINPNSGVTDQWNAACWAGSLALFIAAGIPRSGTGEEIMTSPDGITWTWRDLTALGGLGFSAVTWNGTIAVALGNNAAHSTDGVTWTASTLPVSDGSAGLLGVAWDSATSKFCGIGGYQPAEPVQSANGTTWTVPASIQPYNAITYSAVPSFSLTMALAMDAHRVRAYLSAAPLAASSTGTGDALNPATWSVVAQDGTTLTVLSTSTVAGTNDIDIYVASALLAYTTYTLSTKTLLSSGGNLIHLPASAAFYGMAVGGVGGSLASSGVQSSSNSSAVMAAAAQPTAIDVKNAVVPSSLSVGGTLIIDSDGDYAQESGETLLRKLILRRLTTTPGGFFHLPTYGLGLSEKTLIKPALLPTLKRRIEQQVSLEPDVTDVSASLTWSPATGTLEVLVSGALVKTGQPFTVTAKIPGQA